MTRVGEKRSTALHSALMIALVSLIVCCEKFDTSVFLIIPTYRTFFQMEQVISQKGELIEKNDCRHRAQHEEYIAQEKSLFGGRTELF